jgi:O-antigen ligase
MMNTKAMAFGFQRSQILKWILGVLFIWGIAVILDDFLGLFSFKTGLVLTAEVFLYILLFKRPVWALATLIVVQLTLANYMFPLGGTPVSVNLMWAIMTLLLLVPILGIKGGIELGSGAKRIIVPAIILASMAIISNLLNIDQASTMKYLRQEFIWLVILFLLPAAVKNERDLKRLALVALITCSVSALFALRQYFSLEIRDDLDGRMIGLTIHPSHLGYTLPLVLLPTVAMYFLKGVNSRASKIIFLLIIIMGLGLFVSFTRMGIYSLAPGLLFMILLMRGKPRKYLFLVTLIVGVAFLGYINIIDDNRYTPGAVEEERPEPRWVLWQAGVNIALDNPLFGIGSYQFREVSPEYGAPVDLDLMESMEADVSLGIHEAHNDFITIWASFGTLALLAYLWLVINIFRNFMEASRHSRTRFLKAFTIGCLGAMVAYLVNSTFHNMMSPTMILWIMGGLSIAATKIALSNQCSKANGIS